MKSNLIKGSLITFMLMLSSSQAHAYYWGSTWWFAGTSGGYPYICIASWTGAEPSDWDDIIGIGYAGVLYTPSYGFDYASDALPNTPAGNIILMSPCNVAYLHGFHFLDAVHEWVESGLSTFDETSNFYFYL